MIISTEPYSIPAKARKICWANSLSVDGDEVRGSAMGKFYTIPIELIGIVKPKFRLALLKPFRTTPLLDPSTSLRFAQDDVVRENVSCRHSELVEESGQREVNTQEFRQRMS